MRFATPRREFLPADAIERAYLVGIDGVPWRTKGTWVTGAADGPAEFIMERAVRESGNLVIPWRIEGHGEQLISTTSLMERGEVYSLPVELARGAVNRLRMQLAEWESGNFSTTAEVRALLKGATSHFVRAATAANNPLLASMEAQQAIALAVAASQEACVNHASVTIEQRRQQNAQLTTLFAGAVNPLSPQLSPEFVSAFNTALVPIIWRDLEAAAGKPAWGAIEKLVDQCSDNGLRILAGPLMALDRTSIPDWVYLWEDDFDHLQACIMSHVRSAVQRLRGRVHVWNVASRVNIRGALDVSEEQNLRLIVGAIDTVRSIDARTPLIISFDQPWAEYLATDDSQLSPIHFADSLARADLGLSGLGIELNIGYWPAGSQPRDLLEISRQIDRWSVLGLPLLVFLNIPSSERPDPNARHPGKVVRGCVPGGTTLATHAKLAGEVAQTLLAKPSVQGIIWGEYSDVVSHGFANAGLFDEHGKPKPVLARLRELRRELLM